MNYYGFTWVQALRPLTLVASVLYRPVSALAEMCSPLSPGKSGGVNCDVRCGGKKMGGVPRGAPLVSNTGLNPPLKQEKTDVFGTSCTRNRINVTSCVFLFFIVVDSTEFDIRISNLSVSEV